MECNNCELKQRHTRDFRLKTQHFAADRDEQVAKATKALGAVEAARVTRAGVTQVQTRVDELLNALARLRKDNEKKRDRLRNLREKLAERRRTLAAATSLASPTTTATTPTNTPHPLLAAPLASLAHLSSLITAARVGLVQELVEVFNIVEVGGRPPLGGKAGSRGEWTIGDLILPVPGDVRRYPPQHINAVLGHTVHFLGLLAFYLGSLSASVSQFLPGLGTTPAPSQPSSSQPPQSNPKSSAPAHTADQPNFTTALAMLLHSVLYLAHTQGLAIPLAQAGDVLSNLWAVCCAPELGRRSHACCSYPYLPLPAPAPVSGGGGGLGAGGGAGVGVGGGANAQFSVDFAHVLQAAASGGGRRSAGVARHRRRGWDMVSEDGY
ncbi:UV radiation resistance protein and autophagy-related subunit 14-domain-containing protein [Mycena olivaceomarginata]|nr:UV radiation resistance protein and autophagy-related subunit 14-domain-containing protein [Mycena olivaceomarginata]